MAKRNLQPNWPLQPIRITPDQERNANAYAEGLKLSHNQQFDNSGSITTKRNQRIANAIGVYQPKRPIAEFWDKSPTEFMQANKRFDSKDKEYRRWVQLLEQTKGEWCPPAEFDPDTFDGLIAWAIERAKAGDREALSAGRNAEYGNKSDQAELAGPAGNEPDSEAAMGGDSPGDTEPEKDEQAEVQYVESLAPIQPAESGEDSDPDQNETEETTVDSGAEFEPARTPEGASKESSQKPHVMGGSLANPGSFGPGSGHSGYGS